MKKVLNFFANALIALVVIIAALLVGARVIGLQVFTVLSGSMEPTYHTGALIYVKEVDPSEVKVGDPITFVLNEDLVIATHRVIEIDEANSHFYTKGDANEYPDASPVHFNNLIGEPIFTIPYLGYLAAYIQSPPGMYYAIGFGVVLLAAVFLPGLLDDEKKGKSAKQTEEAKN